MSTASVVQFEEDDKAPTHLNVIGTLVLFWSLICVWRFMSFQGGMLDNATISAWDLVPYYDLPNFVMATWALSTWGAIIGANLLMIRSKLSVPAFAAALLGLIATTAYQFMWVANPVSIYDTPFNFAVWVIMLASVLYTLRVNAMGILK